MLTSIVDFQMAYAPSAWKRERKSWRAVIQLNLVRAVNTVLDALNSEISGKPVLDSAELEDETPTGEITAAADGPPMPFTDKHHLLKLRLTPLRRIEADLRTCLGETADLEEYPSFDLSSDSDSGSSTPTKRKQEFSVRSWKNVLEKNSAYSQTKHAVNHAGDATEVIAGCREDIKSLWDDPLVWQVVNKRKLNLTDSAAL